MQIQKPFKGNFKITQKFGVPASYMVGGVHTGVDWAMPKGTELLAPFNGTISKIERWKLTGYGRNIEILSLNGRYTCRLAHLSEICPQLKLGQKVAIGSKVGLSGNSGYIISLGGGGYHLHFEIKKDGVFVNPLDYIQEFNQTLLTPKQNDSMSAVEQKPAKTHRTYIVQKGDNLWSIALKFYNNGGYHKLIYEENRAVIGPDPNIVKSGTKLFIPKI
jgi:hypothetical protein